LIEHAPEQGVLAKSAQGATYHVAVSAATVVLGFVRSVLLARLLTPDQFGFVGLALFFLNALTPLSAWGIDSALIQNPRPDNALFSTHFSLRMISACLVLVLGLLVAPLLRQIYADRTIVVDVLLILLAVNVLRASFSTPGAILRRDMRFKALAMLNLSSSIAMTVTAPLLAYLGAGLWSLVIEQAVGPLVRWIGIWVFLRPWALSWRIERNVARELLRFGWHVLSASVSGTLLDRFDDFWVGTALGAAALGYYSRAYELAQYPERVLATPIVNVVFSSYAVLQDDRQRLSELFFRANAFLVRVGFLLTAALVVVAPELTEIVFGRTWLPMVPVFQLMLVYLLLDPMYQNLSYLIIAVGQPNLLSWIRWIQVAAFALLVIGLGSLWQINGVAIAADLMMLMGTAVLLAYSQRYIRFSLRRMFLWPAAAAAFSMTIGYLLSIYVHWTGLWIPLLSKSAAVFSAYIAILFLAEREVVREYGDYAGAFLLKRVHKWFPRWRAKMLRGRD
jgi:O-antigen/teichoic acid export membrane protein